MRVPLLTVGDTFEIFGRGIVIAPELPVPAGHWVNRTESVTIAKPTGESFDAEANINLAHMKRIDPAAPQWCILVELPNITKADIPIGSKILVSKQLADDLNRT